LKSKSLTHTLAIVVFIIMLSQICSAITYVQFSVDGDTSATTINQGQTPIITADCGPGNTLTFEFYIDADGSGTVTSGDYELFAFPLIDNDTTAIPDMNATLGEIMTSTGPIGLAPLPYVCKITDEDSTSAEDNIMVMPHPDPPAVISGHVQIDGVSAPSAMLSMFWIENSTYPMVTAITDSMGYYELNMLSESGTDVLNTERDIEGYATPDPIHISWDGDTSGMDFIYHRNVADVYGVIQETDGTPITSDVHIYLVNQSSGVRTELLASGGSYLFDDVEPAEYKIDVTTADLIPDYMTELYWDDPYFHFTLAGGDSLEKNLTCYPTDASITGHILMDGAPAESLYLYAFNYTMGFSKAMSSASGEVDLSVAVGDSSLYRVRYGRESSPIPDGYVVEGTNYLWDEPIGSDLTFNLISDFGSFSGEMYLDPDLADLEDYYLHRITIYSLPDSEFVTHMTNLYDDIYTCYLSPGCYFGLVSDRPGQDSPPAMVKPVGFDSLNIVASDSSSIIDFHYNMNHCDVFLHLEGACVDSIYDSKAIAEGDGTWPDCYYVCKDIPAGSTTVSMQVCDADWHFLAPEIPGYEASPAETTITIDESQTLLHLTFDYTITGIDEISKPLEFEIKGNIPNPFNAATTIEYSIPSTGNIDMGIYDINGRLIRTIIDGEIEAGVYRTIWNGKDNDNQNVPSGLYFVKIHFDNKGITRRIMLIK